MSAKSASERNTLIGIDRDLDPAVLIENEIAEEVSAAEETFETVEETVTEVAEAAKETAEDVTEALDDVQKEEVSE